MSARELVVLGTASQAPTRLRNHNGYLLRFDGQGLLFDPGEGTQRQMVLAGVASSAITRICLTHVHGDHCLGLPGVLQRMSLDGVAHPVHLHHPASGAEYVARLRHATPFRDVVDVRIEPVHSDGVVARLGGLTLEVRRLDHRIEAFGYRLVEAEGRRMRPDLLHRAGVSGRAVGALQRAGSLVVNGRTVLLDEVSEPRRGQVVGFVMDTRRCPGAEALAADADLLVIESTFLHEDAALAVEYGHLTARQAGEIAARAGVRRLVLTHFSQRYADPARFGEQAAEVFDGDVVVAEDLMRVPLPPRR